MLFAVIGFIGLLSVSVRAGSVDPVEALLTESQDKIQPFLEEANILKTQTEHKAEILLKNPGCGCQKQTTEEPVETAQAPEEPLLIFVSLSMPKASLKSLFAEAEKQNARLLLRGLKNNSFRETAAILKELQIGVSIDPALFEQYQVTVVPTFVRPSDHEPLILKGNISVSYARQKFQEAL